MKIILRARFTNSPSAFRAFADALGGSSAGALAGYLLLARFAPGRLEHGWLLVVLLSVNLSSFEYWRVQKARPRRLVAAGLAAVLAGSLLLWWSVGGVLRLEPGPGVAARLASLLQ